MYNYTLIPMTINLVSSLSLFCIHKLRIQFCNCKMNSAGIAQSVLRLGHGLDGQWVGLQFLAGVKNLFRLCNVKTGSEVRLLRNRYREQFPRG
jgi:hypothetical protein